MVFQLLFFKDYVMKKSNDGLALLLACMLIPPILGGIAAHFDNKYRKPSISLPTWYYAGMFRPEDPEKPKRKPIPDHPWFCFAIDIEPAGASREIQERQYDRDRDKEAYDKDRSGQETSERERDRADRYERENMA